MHDDRLKIEARLDRLLRERLLPAIHRGHQPVAIAAWTASGEPVPVATALAADYRPIHIGDPWGTPWGTTWFRLDGTVPSAWDGRDVEILIDVGFDTMRPGFQAEALAYDQTGLPIKGVHPRSSWIPIDTSPGQPFTIYLEAAANPPFVRFPPLTTKAVFAPIGEQGEGPIPNGQPLFRVAQADVAIFDEGVFALVNDLEVLSGLERELDVADPRRAAILRALERAMDQIDPADPSTTTAAARAALVDVLASPAHATAHTVAAVGHAHIDSAWLWPTRETRRKVARTVANVIQLAGRYPDLRFAMSQAQQMAWLEEDSPALFERLRQSVAAGTIIPVGGMWVESDTNMPGGEALARQFVHGKRYFLDRFGVETVGAWLPDSFGYTGALPQLIRASGSSWFLTQKMHWNDTNQLPHHTFQWEGIDGSRVLAHFPSADTYNSELTGSQLAHTSRTFSDHGRASRSLVPYGWGDGGGGPTREMLERAARTRDLEGSPVVELTTPDAFFAAVRTEGPDPPVWSGELYAEYCRGTYTTQARTKRGNRHTEHLLREAELWATTAAVRAGHPYPFEALDRIWKEVLLLQFHDIMAGSSIAWVHDDAEARYARLTDELEHLIDDAIGVLSGRGDETVVFNAAPHERDGVAAMASTVRPPTSVDAVASTRQADGAIVLDNGRIRAVIDPHGHVRSLVDLASGRESIAPGQVGNLLQLHPDLPNEYDAWDIDRFYRNQVTDLEAVSSVTVEPIDATLGEASVRVERTAGGSTVSQVLTVAPGRAILSITTDIDWHASESLIKLAFPLDIHADRATCETQFGHIHRATHTNTSWDAARFEYCVQRWIHVGEPGFGVALVNDTTYGHDVTRTTREDGGTTTTVRATLLRAPRFPDPDADQGVHRFRHDVVVGASIPDAIRAGYRRHLPERVVRGSRGVDPVVAIDDDGIVVESVKLADDRSGDVVLRVYESLGAQTRSRLRTGSPLRSIEVTDLLERPIAGSSARRGDDGTVELHLRPFQILTLRLALGDV